MKRFTLCLIALFIVVIRPKASELPGSSATSLVEHVIIPDSGIKNFEGSLENNKSKLRWSISNNETLNLFEVERSFDGKEFTTVAIVFTAENSGNADYAFKETISSSTITYYRLKLVEKNNKASYSSILTLKNSAE